jgi:hypothetical protein
MKNISTIFLLLFLVILISCNKKNTAIINQKYIDSLLAVNTLSANEKAVQLDLEFWKKRLDSAPDSYTNSQQYAAMLLSKFHLYGNIEDLKNAEKLILVVNKNQKGAESGLFRTLANYSSLQHRFVEANNYSKRASQIGDNQYESQLLLFDAAFELGKIDQARIILNKIKKQYEYAYYFRLAKMLHYDCELEKAIEAMQNAASLTNGNTYLEQAALSNMADLQLHAGDYQAANTNYLKSIAIDYADFHSLKGLGLIAQYHDKNYKLAMKIFKSIAKKTASPDIYFNLTQLAASMGNNQLERKYASQFATISSQAKYGNMYNKYLIELNEGILNDKTAMLAIAQKEVENRNTAQANSWLAWALYKNNKKNEAMAIYKTHISGKPLEGLELYYMGKMMEAENKNYNANSYFEAAYKNRFELAPAKQLELKTKLNS